MWWIFYLYLPHLALIYSKYSAHMIRQLQVLMEVLNSLQYFQLKLEDQNNLFLWLIYFY